MKNWHKLTDIRKLQSKNWSFKVETRHRKNLLEKNIEIAVTKLNIFTVEDLEILLEKSKIEIIPILEKLTSKNIIRDNGDSYIYIPQISKSKEKTIESDSDCMRHMLPFQVKKPKEVFPKYINELDGFIDYFFAPPEIKQNIKDMFKLLKQTQGMNERELKKTLKTANITLNKYNKFKYEISRNGLINLVGSETREPGEIYYFFKEYYLSPKQYSLSEARELAIQRFERLIKIKINRAKVSSAKTYIRWVKKEYSDNKIEKFRNLNFSRFDTEKFFHE